jgi:hypothetical protein
MMGGEGLRIFLTRLVLFTGIGPQGQRCPACRSTGRYANHLAGGSQTAEDG